MDCPHFYLRQSKHAAGTHPLLLLINTMRWNLEYVKIAYAIPLSYFKFDRFFVKDTGLMHNIFNCA